MFEMCNFVALCVQICNLGKRLLPDPPRPQDQDVRALGPGPSGELKEREYRISLLLLQLTTGEKMKKMILFV